MIQLIFEYLEYSKVFKKHGTYNYDLNISKQLVKALNYLDFNDYSLYNKNTIVKLVGYLKNHTGNKNNSINAIVGFMYKVLNYFEIKTNLPKKYKLSNDVTHYRALDTRDLKVLLKYLKNTDSKYKLAIYFLLESGVRFNELIQIKDKNIEYDKNCVLLEHTKNGVKRIAHYGKLTDRLIRKCDPDYFTSITYDGIKAYFNKLKRLLNIDSLHPHMLRKTFATQLLKNGCPITSIQKYLGHSDIKMTMIYLDIDMQMLDTDYSKYYPY